MRITRKIICYSPGQIAAESKRRWSYFIFGIKNANKSKKTTRNSQFSPSFPRFETSVVNMKNPFF